MWTQSNLWNRKENDLIKVLKQERTMIRVSYRGKPHKSKLISEPIKTSSG